MPKDDREIIHGIRVLAPIKVRGNAQSVTYKSGMEDELAAAYSQEELNAMKERGDITGNWKSTKGRTTATTTIAEVPTAASKGDRLAADKTAATDRAAADKK